MTAKTFKTASLVLLCAFGLRHLNSVPARNWEEHYGTFNSATGGWDKHTRKLYTAEGLFGSYYVGKDDWTIIGKSKHFEGLFLQTFGNTEGMRTTLRAIK